MFRKARWGVVTGIVLSAVSLLCAQEIEGLAPREDTVFVKGGNIVLFGGDIYFVDRDTFFVLRPETHFETIYSSRTESLYDTLETRLKRHRWTGELYNMLFRRQRPVGHNVEEDIERTRNAFLPVEGKNIGKIYYHQVGIY